MSNRPVAAAIILAATGKQCRWWRDNTHHFTNQRFWRFFCLCSTSSSSVLFWCLEEGERDQAKDKKTKRTAKRDSVPMKSNKLKILNKRVIHETQCGFPLHSVKTLGEYIFRLIVIRYLCWWETCLKCLRSRRDFVSFSLVFQFQN